MNTVQEMLAKANEPQTLQQKVDRYIELLDRRLRVQTGLIRDSWMDCGLIEEESLRKEIDDEIEAGQ